MKKKIVKIEVDREKCIGAAPCVVLAPNTFELDDEGKAIVIAKDTRDTDEDILSAAQGCPVNAIILTDEEGHQVWPERDS